MSPPETPRPQQGRKSRNVPPPEPPRPQQGCIVSIRVSHIFIYFSHIFRFFVTFFNGSTMAQMKKRLNLESVDTIFYVTFLQDGPPRAPKAAHGTQRCAELQMQKVVSGDLLKHGPFQATSWPRAGLWRIAIKHKKTDFPAFSFFLRLQKKHDFRFPTRAITLCPI